MKSALIFLNGYYDTQHLDFYRQEIETALESRSPLICADGGIWIFDALNQCGERRLMPDVLIGDMDSVADQGYKPLQGEKRTLTQAKHVVQEWIGKTDKDYTDGQLAVDYALEQSGCRHIIIYGGLPRPEGYETDQFLGNLKLMRFGHYRVSTDEPYSAEMRDPKQTIHYVLSAVRLTRKNGGLQRVSLIAETDNVVVEKSENLRWNLASLHIHPDLTNALRNEFVESAEWAALQLVEGSAPVYVIHNW
ncbi:thiamine pyrophosphokinase [Candidatus Poribacteria bacterium]|nr:thiamine pyrophosphokinase [Candidatus Poribacteria bacterium]MYG05806.1 thiamine pyrophosphokinase [Candidatus Poribacteria bacterium]MYK23023.1 thiamine pyrophosphokinase [Candidatus Poribacteria bacterium]